MRISEYFDAKEETYNSRPDPHASDPHASPFNGLNPELLLFLRKGFDDVTMDEHI